jgi:hypothetical protein
MPHTIAENLLRLQTANTNIASAISAKGVTVPSGSGLEDYPTLIGDISGGGGVTPPDPTKPVKFIDYDGTLLYSYTPQEFLALNKMPANKQHQGYIVNPLGGQTYEGLDTDSYWNYTLDRAKSYVSRYGVLLCGQTLKPDGCDLEIHVTLRSDTLSPDINFSDVSSVPYLSVNWGDNSDEAYYSQSYYDAVAEYGDPVDPYEYPFSSEPVTMSHTYQQAGDYVIRISLFDPMNIYSSGAYIQGTNMNNDNYYSEQYASNFFVAHGGTGDDYGKYARCVKKIFTSPYIKFSEWSLYNFESLETLSIGPTVMFENFGDFEGPTVGVLDILEGICSCGKLKALVFPLGVERINAVTRNYSLEYVSLPDTKLFYSEPDYSEMVYILNTTYIDLNIGSVNQTSYPFEYCANIKELYLPDNDPDNYKHTYVWKNGLFGYMTFTSMNQNSIDTFVVPKGGNLYSATNGLRSVTTIGYSRTVKHLIISETVTEAFNPDFIQYCTCLESIKFLGTTPPPCSVGSANFNLLPRDCKIYVPQAALSAYQAASNYPDPTVWQYVGY